MKLMLKWGLLAAVLTGLVGTAVPAQAISFTANACVGGKLACVTKNKACLLGCYKKFTGAAPVDIACLTKCRTKFLDPANEAGSCFGKLVAKYGGECATTGDAAAIECKVDGFVQGAVGELVNGNTLTGSANKCLAGKIGSLLGYNKCRLGLLIKAAKTRE